MTGALGTPRKLITCPECGATLSITDPGGRSVWVNCTGTGGHQVTTGPYAEEQVP